MKAVKTFYSIFLLLACFSCVYDYDIDESDVIERNRIVVNCILNPCMPLEINFYSIRRENAGYACKPLKNVHVTLRANDQIVYDAVSPDTLLQLDYYPQPGMNYSLQASADGFEPVSASTSVPDSMIFTTAETHQKQVEVEGVSPVWVTRLSGFRYDANTQASLFLTAYAVYEKGAEKYFASLFANDALLDNINRKDDYPWILPTVGSLYHELFLRVKNKNLLPLKQIVFVPNNLYSFWGEDLGAIIQLHVKLTSASKEFDRYYTSRYYQRTLIIYEDNPLSIVYQPSAVYSNIRNGMGIFAGVSESNYYLDIKNE
jgi:hypothetical protein